MTSADKIRAYLEEVRKSFEYAQGAPTYDRLTRIVEHLLKGCESSPNADEDFTREAIETAAKEIP